MQYRLNFHSFRHGAGQKLSGVVYLHRITDNRVGGVSAKNMRLFRAICGADALKNVVLCTTMWDKANRHEGDRRDAERREGELKNEFWKAMMEAGSTVARHDKTRESALNIVRPLLGLEPVTLQLPKEIEYDVPLPDTTAGVQLGEEYRILQELHRKEMQALREEMVRATEAAMRELEAEMRREMDALRRVEQEQRDLLAERDAEVARLQQELENNKGGGGGGGGGPCVIL